LNQGLKLAKGKYVLYASADDIVVSTLLEKSVTLLEQFPKAAFCSALVNQIDENGKHLGRWPSPIVSGRGYIPPDRVNTLLQRHGIWFMGNTLVFRRQALIEEGGFFPELGLLCDSFIMQITALRHGVCFIPEYLAWWRKADQGYSMSTLADSRKAMEFMNIAQRLMRTKYRDLFPPGYAERWKKEWIYAIGLASGKRFIRNHNDYIESLRHALLPLNWFDHALFSVSDRFVSVKICFMRFYLFVRLQQLTWDKVTRRLKSGIHVFTRWVNRRKNNFK
jgi:glycosyltransferase involved in cell wall biosynthesis